MEGYITGLLELNVMGGLLMERYASIEPFVFSISVLSLTIRTTNVKNLVANALKPILNPSFITVDMFALVVPYLVNV